MDATDTISKAQRTDFSKHKNGYDSASFTNKEQKSGFPGSEGRLYHTL